MTKLVAAMRAVVNIKRHKPNPARRAGSMLSLRPSSLAVWYEIIRRVLLAAIGLTVCSVIAIESVSMYRQGHTEQALSEYRMVIYDFANTVRAMRTKAIAQGQPYELRIDPARRTLSVSSLSRGSSDYAALDRTIWLPEGLEISEAPLWITAHSNGALTPGSIVITAPVFRRLFRLMISHRGVVELYEETLS